MIFVRFVFPDLQRLSLVRRLLVSPRRHQGTKAIVAPLTGLPVPSWPRDAALTGEGEVCAGARLLVVKSDAAFDFWLRMGT